MGVGGIFCSLKLFKCATFAGFTLLVFISTTVAAGWLLDEARTQQQKVKVGDGLCGGVRGRVAN